MAELAAGDDIYSVKWFKQKLLDRYEDEIYFAAVDGRPNVICFKSASQSIINDEWYEDRKNDQKDEAKRIIETAAKLILSEIREIKCDGKSYPSAENIAEPDEDLWLPDYLRHFMKLLVKSPLRQRSIGQCLVYAARPRSVIPPIPFGLGVEMDHVVGSKWAINELHRLGFSISYDEVNRFKQNVVRSIDTEDEIQSSHPEGSFTQWIGDNIDHNIATLDGKNAFHGMGIIRTTTGPFSTEKSHWKSKVPREEAVKAKEVVAGKGVKIVQYISSSDPGLDATNLKPIDDLCVQYSPPLSVYYDLIWHSGYFLRNSTSLRPSWSGFMQEACTGSYPAKSEVRLLPIVDLNPSNLTCIYSTLLFVESQAKNLGIITACITFDQPLWMKAMDIIKSKSMKIVCRLGGFHMLMSFMGSIGTMMNGSGLEDALATVYGENTIQHMLSGKAVSRALRGHFLVEAALTNKLFENFLTEESKQAPTVREELENSLINEEEGDKDTITEKIDTPCSQELVHDDELLLKEEIQELTNLYECVKSGQAQDADILNSGALMKLNNNLEALKSKLSDRSRTAKLWIQYMDYVQILKIFIRAERTGNWHLHLAAVSKMLNLFAATGHINYAKSARIYLQSMLELPTEYPWLYQCFAEYGYHTVRRSDRFWSGLWTDLVIEQVMMRSVKSRGGLTRGRGFSESVRHMWVHSSHQCAEIHHAMTLLTGLHHETSEQHKDLGQSRMTRDNTDLLKIQQWFEMFEPFDPNDSNLRSLSSGLVASKESGVNCDKVEEVGKSIHKTLDNKMLHNAKIKRRDKIVTLDFLKAHIKIDQEPVPIDPTVLFSRLLLILQREDDLAPYFAYELSSVPTSLFKSHQMRKGNKALLSRALIKETSEQKGFPVSEFVLDGGALLHRVTWLPNSTYGDVIQQYIEYVKTKFGFCNIVFDGYSSGPSIKDQEHLRRKGKTSADINVQPNLPAYSSQQAFLTNITNKVQFIQLLGQALSEEGHRISYSNADADTLIASTALELASSGKNTVVVADDTDVLVILLRHWKGNMADICFRSEAKRNADGSVPLYSIKSISTDLGEELRHLILFIHAWSGCDSTSAIFGQGKTSTLALLKRSKALRVLCTVFGKEGASPEDISKAGQSVFAVSYGGNADDSLNVLRYQRYLDMVASKTAKLGPQKLPPTERSAHFHSLRVHLQVRLWETLGTCEEDPLKWGWFKDGANLVPVMTDKAVAPDNLLMIIRCKCKVSTKNVCGTNLCSCRRSGLKCVAACQGCCGESCNNVAIDVSCEVVEEDGNIFDIFEDFV